MALSYFILFLNSRAFCLNITSWYVPCAKTSYVDGKRRDEKNKKDNKNNDKGRKLKETKRRGALFIRLRA